MNFPLIFQTVSISFIFMVVWVLVALPQTASYDFPLSTKIDFFPPAPVPDLVPIVSITDLSVVQVL